MINYKHLNYFVSIVRWGGVSRAAEQLHLTPQTLSGQIAQFEERLGVALFQRVGRRLELTEAGRLARRAGRLVRCAKCVASQAGWVCGPPWQPPPVRWKTPRKSCRRRMFRRRTWG